MEVVDSDSEPEWEKMQIQKAMSGQQVASCAPSSCFNAFFFSL